MTRTIAIIIALCALSIAVTSCGMKSPEDERRIAEKAFKDALSGKDCDREDYLAAEALLGKAREAVNNKKYDQAKEFFLAAKAKALADGGLARLAALREKDPASHATFARAVAHLGPFSTSGGANESLTSALIGLAEPGELLLTAELRDRLADGVDADFEDLGYRRVPSHTKSMRLF